MKEITEVIFKISAELEPEYSRVPENLFPGNYCAIGTRDEGFITSTAEEKRGRSRL